MKINVFQQIGFDKFFKHMFFDTDVSKFNDSNKSSDDQIVIVKNTVYFKNLNEALKKNEMENETLGKFSATFKLNSNIKIILIAKFYIQLK